MMKVVVEYINRLRSWKNINDHTDIWPNIKTLYIPNDMQGDEAKTEAKTF